MTRPKIDDTLLLGYLLNSLEPDELLLVENAIEVDSSVRDRLAELNEEFKDLLDSASNDTPEPRGDLASLTIQAIHDQGLRNELSKPSRWARFCERTKFFSAMSPAESLDSSGRACLFRSALEISTVAICVLVFGVVILSNTHLAREQARQNRCAYQLLNIGHAIQDYAFHGSRQTAPELEIAGPLSFAGIYAPKLNDQKLLTNQDSIWCPNSEMQSVAMSSATIESLPSVRQLIMADSDQLEIWKRWIGGSYAYNLGVVSKGEYRMPRYQSRSNFAILGDAPRIVDDQLDWSNHGLNRCNILYEDGRVALRVCGPSIEIVNHPYLNENGELKAGCHEEDSALGPSFFGPLGSQNLIRIDLNP